jgi:PAS domain S-box-containing protein
VDADPVRELLRTLPGVVYRCAYDVEWTMQLISDEIVVVTGFPADGFVGNRDRSFASVIHPDDRERVAVEISAQLAEQDDFACEYRLIRADGVTVWILERGRRVRGLDGPRPLLDGLLFDITERKRAQEELRASVAEQAAHRAVTEERTNVARELHDSVGHTLSVVALHAGVATTQLPAGSDAAAATLGIIRDVVKETTNDIDRLLRTLSAAPGGPVASGLNDVSSLVERVRAAGVPVALVIEGEPRQLPPELDHTAFRVIQEGLTNVMKHARDAAVSIRVEHGSRCATLEVVDHGPMEAAPPTGSRPAERRRGRGLAGLRGRVNDLGGDLTAGPRAGGGFTMTTVLPYGGPDGT